ncbi:MAG: alcohol dehydrogenase catalytic domain-containing protein [Candidatus Promineifilaceae bacterium]|nr:alcohol dehydrogenase catalytic domain-containing protein [Candidatus Promineifilaceae bacterium]
MQALYYDGKRLEFRDDYPVPEPGDGQALIRLHLAGICSTDLEIVKGYAAYRGVLGHEFVGVVEAAADGDWIGRRVVGGINLGCGACAVCLSAGSEHCPKRTVLGIIDHDGAFADYLVLPVENLHEVPDDLVDEMAVFTEPLAAAVRIREQVKVRPTAKVAVVGPGRLGLLIGQVLALSGTSVTMLGRNERSLRLPARLGLATSLVDDQPADAFELVVEATGNEAGLAHALRLVRPLGTLVLKSTFAGRANVDLTKLVVAEITVVGSRCGPFAPALRLLRQGSIEVRSLIEAEYPLREGRAAFEHAAQPRVRKVLLRP